MSGDSLGVVLALIVAFGTALAGAITAWRRAPNDNVGTLSQRVSTLEKRVEKRDLVIDHLSSWQVAARLYILTLRGALADRGIPSPVPPEELEIWREEVAEDDES